MRSEQVLYLTVSLNEPYNLLKILNSNIKVNLNMFCELTLQNTRLFDSIPHVVYAFAMRLFAFYLQYCENKLNYLNHLIILYLKLLLIFLLDSNNNSPNVMVHRWIYFQQIHISFPTFQMLLHSLSRNWFTIALIDDFTTALQCSTLIQSFLLTTSPPPCPPPPPQLMLLLGT